jgi:outer membrane protein assembly factor BamB
MTTDLPEIAAALPDYDVGPEIGRGQFGVIRSGRHRQLHRDVAIKQLAGPVSDQDAARFRREARILAQLDHPHVVRVFDLREQGELRLYVMELLPGGTLADLRAARMPVESAVAATLAAATALQNVHQRGVLHRDIKPENLMFDSNGTLKVTDFGIASDDGLGATAVGLTRAGEFFGTPAYASPEQARRLLGESTAEVGPAADQYALAAVLYEILSGRLTHDDTGGAAAILARRTREPAHPLAVVAPATDPRLASVVMRALERSPQDRYPSVEAFAVALAGAATQALGPDWLSRSGVRLRDMTPVVESGSASPASASRGAGERPRRRRRPVVAFAAAAMVLLAAAVGVAAWSRGSSDDSGAAGTSAVRTDAPELTVRWTVPTGNAVISSPAVDGAAAGEVVAVGSNDQSVYAINGDGSVRWKEPTGGRVRSSPAVADGVVFVGSDDAHLYALDLATGGRVWPPARAGTLQISGGAVVAGDQVLIGSDRLYAFGRADGAPLWSLPMGRPIESTPAVDGSTAVVGSTDGVVHGVDLGTRTERWHKATGASVVSSPTIDGGVAFVGSDDHRLYAFRVTDGSILWSRDLGSPVVSSPLVTTDRVVVGTVGGRLVAVDRSGGKVLWDYDAAADVASSPTLVGSTVVVGTEGGEVLAVSLDDGRLRGWSRLGGPVRSSPAAVSNGVVVGSNDGSVVRIGGITG